MSLRIRSPWTPPSTGGGSPHGLGFNFSCDTTINAEGVWWWHPISGVTGPTAITVELYNTGTTARLATSSSTSTAAFLHDDWNLVLFNSMYVATAGNYSVNVYAADGGEAFDGSALASADIVDGSGHVRMLQHGGCFINGSGAQFPSSTWDGLFGVDLSFSFPAGVTQGLWGVDA